MQTLWQDLRFGARLLRLNPAFSLVAILSLALGIGANTAIFQLLDALRMRTLPVKNPHELANVHIADRPSATGRFTGPYSQLTNPQWEQIRDHQQDFSHIAAWGREPLNLALGGEARYAQALWISGDFFNVVQVPAAIGRVFTPEDDHRGCDSPGVVISFPFWQREFGGDPAALGRKLTLEGHAFDVIGITPASFFGVEVGRHFDLAVPLCAEPTIHGEGTILNMRFGWWLASIGRLKPGVTHQQASAHLKAMSTPVFEATLPTEYNAKDAKNYLGFKLEAIPIETGFSNLRRAYENPLWMLLAIAGAVLLIACANLANLMLARASAREREIAVRLAMGASRGRLVRQLLVESLLVASVGAALGAGLAQALSRFLVVFLSSNDRPLFVDLHPDARVLGFTMALAALTCIVFGLTPAFRATNVSAGAVLKAAGRGVSGSRERSGLRRALVVTQVAVSLVLVVGALLFVRSLRNLLTLDPGFQQEGVLVAQVDYSRLDIPAERRWMFKRDLVERIRAVPGVDAVADAAIVPISGNAWNENVLIDGSEQRKGLANFSRVTPGYFKSMQTVLLAGRDFDEHDTATSPRVAIVNEAFARKLLNGKNPVGAHFKIEEYVGRATPMYEIIGLAKDTKYIDLREEFGPIVFLSGSQDERPDAGAQLVIRSRIPTSAMLPSVRQALIAANPALTLTLQSLTDQVQDSLLRERLMATLSGFFGILAGILATVGLYGVISYTVARRTNEIGVRIALGADRATILRMILREAGILVAGGLVVGAGIALAVARTAESLLFGLKSYDPVTMVLAVVALAAISAAASLIPAYRASRLDPMAALRDE